MEDYVNEFMDASRELNSIGKPVDDELLGAMMLQGLPESYEPMVMAIEHSVSQLVSKGYVAVFDKNGCKIQDSDSCNIEGEIQATTTEMGGIYRLNIKELANVATTSTHLLWHKRLRQLNRVSM
ncbi:hypothetical protein JTB14_031810 [Gonioctena quinquepunctata]|nr:hypothetical protein JTB14_031810 [Gonioctena quinquepunctata]